MFVASNVYAVFVLLKYGQTSQYGLLALNAITELNRWRMRLYAYPSWSLEHTHRTAVRQCMITTAIADSSNSSVQIRMQIPAKQKSRNWGNDTNKELKNGSIHKGCSICSVKVIRNFQQIMGMHRQLMLATHAVIDASNLAPYPSAKIKENVGKLADGNFQSNTHEHRLIGQWSTLCRYSDAG